MTSSEVIVCFTGTPMGTCSSLISRGPSGCWRCHIHCFPTTKISMEALGGREFAKYRLELHTNITAQSAVGNSVQVSSSERCVSVCGGRSSSERRRYLMAKYKSAEKMIKVKKSVMPVRKKWSLSTPSAMVDPGSGRMGIPSQVCIAKIEI